MADFSKPTNPHYATSTFPSPQASSTLNHYALASTNTIPSTQLFASGFPLAANGRPVEANGMYNPIPTFYCSSDFANFATNGSQVDVSGYPRLYSYSPGTLIQPRVNSMHNPPNRQTLFAGKDVQRQKKQRPFNTIDASMLRKVLNQQPSPTAVACIESSASASMNSSPRRQSPDSPCIGNGSSGADNSNESQDANGESSRKNIRRTPPEEKDEKYFETRRKNNLAAKKSRVKRRDKAELLARSEEKLTKEMVALAANHEHLQKEINAKGARLEMLMSCLISFRGQLEGRKREIFEETFSSLLPPSSMDDPIFI